MVRWCWVKFLVPGRPTIVITVRQRPTTLVVGAGGGCLDIFTLVYQGWSGGAKVLGKLSVPGRPTSLDDSRARAYCACSRCGWGLFGHFFSHLSFLFSFSLSLGDGPI